MKPEISIIVPVYNVEKYLQQCLDSILAQSFENFEVILVNDGSTDSSGEICSLYTKKDNRIKIYHKKNGGVSSARNIGVKLCTGKYILFVDSDDYILKDYCEKLLKISQKSNSDIVICKMVRELSKNKKTQYNKKFLNREEALIEMFKGNLYRFSLSAKLFKASIVKEEIFPTGMIHEDQGTTYKYFLKAKKVLYIDYPGYVYFYRENSILTEPYNKRRLDSFDHWKKIILNLKNESKNIKKEMFKRYSYWIIDNIFYILNSNEDKNIKLKYLSTIKQSIKGHKIKLLQHSLNDIKQFILLFIFIVYYRLVYYLKG